MHGRKKGKTRSLALKLDISKAYDLVEWDFLRGIMTKLGFPEVWINWVMTCITTPTFSVLINGKSFGHISPSRGLRQGNPLSPYLFLLCAEGFTALLAKAELEERIHGVSICRRAPRISHLLFANDSLLFCQATHKEVKEVTDILQTYGRASGQCINMDKSLVLFSSNTSNTEKDWVKNTLGVKEVERFETYLGLPTMVGRAKYQSFAYLKDKVWKKLQGWKGFGGDKLKMKGRYIGRVGGSCLNQKERGIFSTNSSYVWKSLMATMPILKQGSCWRVGNGASISVMRDKWIVNHPTCKVLHPLEEQEWEWRVSDMIDPNLRCWDRELIWNKFHEEDAEAICRIPLSHRCVADKLIWIHNRNGKYSVKYGYHVARQILRADKWTECSSGSAGMDVWMKLLKLNVPCKIKIFGWRAYQNILPTHVNLAQRKIIENTCCVLCQRAPENGIHALWECSVAQGIWAGSVVKLQKCTQGQGDVLQLFDDLLKRYKLNFDAAIFTDKGRSGVGAVIRNERGEVMATLSAMGPFVQDSEEAEIVACRKALEFAIDACFTDLVIEGDTVNVVRAIDSNCMDSSRLGTVIEDIHCLVSGLRWSTVSCVKRSANTIAHCLAQFAKNVSEELVWIEDCPQSAKEALLTTSMSSSQLYRCLHGICTTSLSATSTATQTNTVKASARNAKTKERRLQKAVDSFKKSSESDRIRARHGIYESTVRRLATAKKFSMIEEILEAQKKYPEIAIEGFAIRLISLYGKAGMFDHAHKVFDEMPDLNCPRTVKSFNTLLAACVSTKKFDKVDEIFRGLPPKLSIEADLVSYNVVIKAFCEMGSLDTALSMFDELEKNGMEPDSFTFNTLL
ncbi:hypothetical protein SO802_007643 [Lithocarpus litseifolius]|uniref:Reverse transcriptase domain-containing protein n=1 Tax=Lithocarpus litseifolius TaxID=425828 RepID=A0AAW2DTE2_9ROSI